MTKYLVFFAAICALAVAVTVGARENRPPVDSGRYGFDLDCRNIPDFLECSVVARDLVYDTVLVDTTLAASASGGLGGSVSFEGRPAQGTPQRITLAVQAQDSEEFASLEVQVHEGKHLVQQYSLTFPLAN